MRCSSVVLPAPLGPSRPVTPAGEGAADVVDRDHVAVPARDVVDDDAGARCRSRRCQSHRCSRADPLVMPRSADSAGWSGRT